MRNARQHAAFLLFLSAQAWPFDFIADLALLQLPNAGAARAIAARTGPVYAAQFRRDQQRLIGPGVKLLATG